MKYAKRLAAILLAVCILIGMPMSVSAVGTAVPTEMKLVGLMPIASDIRVGSALHTNATWGDKGLMVFFNQPVPSNIGSTRCFIVVVDGNNQVVNYNGTNLIWSTTRSTAELWQIRGNFICIASSLTIGGKSVGSWTTIAEALTTDAALANKGYKVQLRMMGVSGEVTNNGYVDTVVNNGQKLAANLKVINNSTPTNGGSTDCYYAEIGVAVAASGTNNAYIKPTNIVTLDQVAMVDQTNLTLTFSQAVTVDTARNDAVLEIVSADGNTVSKSYGVTLTAGNAVTVPATLTEATWDQIRLDLTTSPVGSYIRFKMTEKNINTAYGENQFNFVVDTVWGKDTYAPLRSNTGATPQYAHDFVVCRVDEPVIQGALEVVSAQPLYTKGTDGTVSAEHVVVTFSEPVTVASARYFCLRKISKNGTGGVVGGVNVTLDYATYYGASGKQLLFKLRTGTVDDVWNKVGTLGANERLVVMAIDKVNHGDLTMDSIYATADSTKKLQANLFNASEDMTVIDLSTQAIRTLDVKAVYVHKERNLIVSFDQAIVATPNMYSAIRLVDANNTLYWANKNDGGATAYASASATGTNKPLQWQVSAVTLNNTGASQYGYWGQGNQQLLGTLGINYSAIKAIEAEAEAWFAAQGTPKDLTLKLVFEEKNVSTDYGKIVPNSYSMDAVYAADGSAYLISGKSQINAAYVNLTEVEDISLVDTYAVSGSAVELVFSAPVKTDVYSKTKAPSVQLQVLKADGTAFKLNTGYAPVYDGKLIPVAASGSDADGYTRWQLADLYQAAYGNMKINIMDILAAMSADRGQFAGCSLRLNVKENIDVGNAIGLVDNITSADASRILKANAGDDTAAVTVDDVTTEAVTVEKVEIIAERKLKVTFSEAVKMNGTLQGMVRLTDADGFMLAYDNGNYNKKSGTWIQWTGTFTPVEGSSDDEWIATINWASNSAKALGAPLSFTRILGTWEKEWKNKGYVLNFTLEDGGLRANGLIEQIESVATGRKLVADNLLGGNAEKAGWNDFSHTDICQGGFFESVSPQVTEVKQYAKNSVLVTFNQPMSFYNITLAQPYIGLRLVSDSTKTVCYINVATNKITHSAWATYEDGAPQYWNTVTKSATRDEICKDANGNIQYDADNNPIKNPRRQNTVIQWNSVSKELINDGKQMIVTFADNVDVAALVNEDSLLDYMKNDYSVMFCIEETDTKDGTFLTEDMLIHNFVNAYGRQLLANKSGGNNGLLMDVELIDPDAPVTVIESKITGEMEITFRFSEPVDFAGNMHMALLRYVDKTTGRLIQTAEDGYVQWSGILRYADDTKTTAIWTMRANNPANKNLRQENLAEVFDIVKSKESLKGLDGCFSLCLEESKNNVAGFIDTFYAVSGKTIEAQPYIPNWSDGVYIPVDPAQAIRGELDIVKAEAVKDNELVITFSAPVTITADPWFCIRLFDAKNSMIMDDKTPMQWGLTVVSLSKDGTQLRLALNSNSKMKQLNLTEILAYDWSSYGEGAHIRFFVEEKNAPMITRSGHVDNIALASDGRIRLDATDFNERDGAGAAITMSYNPVTIQTSATVINENQLRIAFSHKIDLKGEVYMALCYVDDDYNLLSHLELGKHYPQWGGAWEWENESHTSIIWTMNAGMYGCKTISDIVNKRGMLSDLYADANILFRIEEKKNDALSAVGWTGLVDNISALGGTVHLPARGSGMDRHFITLSNTKALAGEEVHLLSVKALDNKTLELTFSEAVVIKEGDQAPIMAIRYLTASGDTEVGVDGRTLSFGGTCAYKDDSKKVVIWTLDEAKAAKRGAKSLDDIFTYANDFRWNEGARIAFVVMDEEENALTGAAMRVCGITDLSGYRNLVANKSGDVAQIQLDIEIGYELPVINEEIVETVYVTDYLLPIIGGGVLAVSGIAVAVVLIAGRKKKED